MKKHLPNFMIVGAPKAGTTSLYHYLSEHPDVFMSEPKEVNFFSREEIEAQGLYYSDFKAKTWDDYQRLFDGVTTEKAVGEGSVSYLFYPDTPQKIKAAIPDVKIIILLRNPVERAFSHYLMDYRMGLVDLPFEDVVLHQAGGKKSALLYQQYVELGLYYEQVKRYVDTFGSAQVKIYFQDDLRHKGEKVVEDLYAFLGIDVALKPDLSQEYNTFTMPKNGLMKALYASGSMRLMINKILPQTIKDKLKDIAFEQKKKPELSEETKKHLQAIYHDDIGSLEVLLAKDLSAWK